MSLSSFHQGTQYARMMLLDSCLQVTFLSQFVIVNTHNTVLGGMILEYLCFHDAQEQYKS